MVFNYNEKNQPLSRLDKVSHVPLVQGPGAVVSSDMEVNEVAKISPALTFFQFQRPMDGENGEVRYIVPRYPFLMLYKNPDHMLEVTVALPKPLVRDRGGNYESLSGESSCRTSPDGFHGMS